jgi:hypothetical protein
MLTPRHGKPPDLNVVPKSISYFVYSYPILMEHSCWSRPHTIVILTTLMNLCIYNNETLMNDSHEQISQINKVRSLHRCGLSCQDRSSSFAGQMALKSAL